MTEPEINHHPSRCQEVSGQYRWPGQLMKNRLCKKQRYADKSKFQNHKKY